MTETLVQPAEFSGMRKVIHRAVWILGAVAAGCGSGRPGPPADAPIEVVATVTDLASLAREVGGERVSVTCLVPGESDPHAFELRASDVERVARSRLVVAVGHGTEAGWLPALLAGSGNARVAVGQDGYLDLGAGADGIAEAPGGDGADHGHSHHPGAANPHYLLDPLEGVRAALELARRLSTVDPDHAEHYRARYQAFALRLCGRLVGGDAVKHFGTEAVVAHLRAGTLDAALGGAGMVAGGWIAAMRAAALRPVVGDHDHWPYFARRFGVEIVGHLEPEPGVAPTPRHLEALIARMTEGQVAMVWMSPFMDPRVAEAVLARTGARAVALAHQTGARAGADDYLALFDQNVGAITAAAPSAVAGSGK